MTRVVLKGRRGFLPRVYHKRVYPLSIGVWLIAGLFEGHRSQFQISCE